MTISEEKADVERSVLGELTLATAEKFEAVLSLGLNAGMFTYEGHRMVFHSIRRLFEAGVAVDMVTVRNDIGPELLSRFGGDEFLVALLNSACNAFHLEHHIGVLEKLSWRESKAEQLKQAIRQLEDSATPVDVIRNALRATFDETENDESQLPAFVNSPVSLDEFLKRNVKPEYLINRVLSKGEEMIVGAPEKTLKTCILADMAISLGSGTPFLGADQFAVKEPCRVDFMTIETGTAALQSLLARVARAKQLHPEDIGKRIKVSQELPVIANDWHMRELKKYVVGEGIESLLIDPAYLTLFGEGSKVQASNLFEMGPLLRRITEVRKETGVTFVMAHHTRKSQNKPDFFTFRRTTRDDLSQAGFSQWMRQWILPSRKAAYSHDGKHTIHLEIGGSSGHGGEYVLQVDEGKQDNGENQILTDWQTTVTPAHEYDEAARAERQEQTESQKDEMLERNVAKVLNAMKAEGIGKSLSKNTISGSSALNYSNTVKALYELKRRGEVKLDDTNPNRLKWSLTAESDKPDN